MGRKSAVIMSLYRNDTIEFVTLAVESILNQSYTDFDLYIQYDGPIKDEVDAYLSHLNDERIHIYKRLENKGLAQSLNDLLKIVKPLEYDYIARMDADDISTTDRFENRFIICNPILILIWWGVQSMRLTKMGVIEEKLLLILVLQMSAVLSLKNEILWLIQQ